MLYQLSYPGIASAASPERFRKGAVCVWSGAYGEARRAWQALNYTSLSSSRWWVRGMASGSAGGPGMA